MFSVSITQTQIFEFWVMKTQLKNQSKQVEFGGLHIFWVLGDLSISYIYINTVKDIE